MENKLKINFIINILKENFFYIIKKSNKNQNMNN